MGNGENMAKGGGGDWMVLPALSEESSTQGAGQVNIAHIWYIRRKIGLRKHAILKQHPHIF